MFSRFLFLLALVVPGWALVVPQGSPVASRRRAISYNMFSKAFENNPAYKKDPAAKQPTVPVTFKSASGSAKTVQALPGQQMQQVANSARVKILYNCKNGECGTCESLLDGKRVVRLCQMKVPKGGCTIVTKN